MAFENNDSKSALEAKQAAQFIAFAPVIFQVARCMRKFGIFDILCKSKNGLTVEEIVEQSKLNTYAVKLLLETSLSADLVKLTQDRFQLTNTGYFLTNDYMSTVNLDYNHYVNYLGLYYLEESLEQGKAVGLKHAFGGDDTIYPMLSNLPEDAKKAWFDFDHFYSDTAFEELIDKILEFKPKKVLDIGANTGKFAIAIASKDKDVKVGLADLKEQIVLCKENIKKEGFEDRAEFFPINILDKDLVLPTGFDAIVMSQFLDCFTGEDVVNILNKVKKAASEDTKIIIQEPLWDKQKFETSAFCIINTSPYFAALANGYSKMFSYKDLAEYIESAGLKITHESHDLGICQSMIVCQKA